MLLTDRVGISPHICGIELDLSSIEFAAGNLSVQPFYNSNLTDSNFNEVYRSTGSIRFSENSEDTVQGLRYTQSVSFKFPSNDFNRSERLEELRKTKFIQLKISNDSKLLLGRNDFFQNRKPIVTVSSNEKVTQVQFNTQSIFPIGFASLATPVGFAYEFPISFLQEL